MFHRGNELIEISFLEKSWLPPKKIHYQTGPALKAGTARKGGRGHKVAPGSCQATGHLAPRQLALHSLAERHPGLQDHCPRVAWAGRCPQLQGLPHA